MCYFDRIYGDESQLLWDTHNEFHQLPHLGEVGGVSRELCNRGYKINWRIGVLFLGGGFKDSLVWSSTYLVF